MVDYNKRLVEVDEVLSCLSEEELLKIPEDIRQAIKGNKDKEYVWKYDVSKELKDQNLNRDTIIILSYLNIEYLLNNEQKQLMKEIHRLNELKAEEIKRKKYDTENLFKTKETEQKDLKEFEQGQALIEYKESFFTKVISKIKNFFERLVG